MKRLIAVLISCIAAAAFAAGLSEREFTDAFVKQAKAAFADTDFKIVAPLELQTKDKDGSVGTIFLTNAYTQYTSNPEALQAIIGSHLSGMTASKQTVDSTSSSSIFPVIKPPDYLTTVAAQRAKAGITQEISFVVENLNEDLLVLYVIDTESSMQILTKEGMKQTGVEETALRSIGVRNLGKYFDEKQVRIERVKETSKGAIYQVLLDENYEASILLLDQYWNKKNFDVPGDIIVFVPARNMVIVTGSEDKEGLTLASRVAQSSYDELGYAISPYGYRRVASAWTRFEP